MTSNLCNLIKDNGVKNSQSLPYHIASCTDGQFVTYFHLKTKLSHIWAPPQLCKEDGVLATFIKDNFFRKPQEKHSKSKYWMNGTERDHNIPENHLRGFNDLSMRTF